MQLEKRVLKVNSRLSPRVQGRAKGENTEKVYKDTRDWSAVATQEETKRVLDLRLLTCLQ